MFWDIFFQCYLFFYSFSRTGHPWGMQLLQLNVSQHSVLSCSLTVPVIEQLQSGPRPSPALSPGAAFPGAVPPPARGGPVGLVASGLGEASTSLHQPRGSSVQVQGGARPSRPSRARGSGSLLALGLPRPTLHPLLLRRVGVGPSQPLSPCVPAACRPAACQGQAEATRPRRHGPPAGLRSAAAAP